MMMDIQAYNNKLSSGDKAICDVLFQEINTKDLKRWLAKSERIQWDYKNLIKRKVKLERLK
jgi:hypothetical protein